MGEEPKINAKLAEFLAEIAGMAEFPALSHSIEQVLLKVDEEVSIQHITNVILKDYSLTLRILRTANSALNNRSGRQIHLDIARGGAAWAWRRCGKWLPEWCCWSISASTLLD